MPLQNPCKADTSIILSDLSFGNAVWRIYFIPIRKPNEISFNWHINHDNGESYSIRLSRENATVIRNPGLNPEVILLGIEQTIIQNKWHLLEINSYNATLGVWLDGTQILEYEDPIPLPPDHIALGVKSSEFEESMVYFDNISVCELTAPFVSAYSSGQQ